MYPKINKQILFNIVILIIVSLLVYLYFENKKESFEGIAGTSFVSRVPKGTIVAFNGTVAPVGWVLCNGKNGTPDLRGRFIRMFSSDLPPDDNNNSIYKSYVKKYIGPNVPNKDLNGNARDFQLSWVQKLQLNYFGGTDLMRLNVSEIPSHSHNVNASVIRTPGASNSPGYGSGSNNTNLNSFYTENTGGGESHNNTPPYYVLAYIMKL